MAALGKSWKVPMQLLANNLCVAKQWHNCKEHFVVRQELVKVLDPQARQLGWCVNMTNGQMVHYTFETLIN